MPSFGAVGPANPHDFRRATGERSFWRRCSREYRWGLGLWHTKLTCLESEAHQRAA